MKLSITAILLTLSTLSSGQECPSIGTNEVIGNPVEWSLNCFSKLTYRTNLPSDLLIWHKDIFGDDGKELLISSRQSHGNSSGNYFVFKLDDEITYIGSINTNLDTLRMRRENGIVKLSYFHNSGYEQGAIVNIEYIDGAFVHTTREEVSKSDDLVRICNLWPNLYRDCE